MKGKEINPRMLSKLSPSSLLYSAVCERAHKSAGVSSYRPKETPGWGLPGL